MEVRLEFKGRDHISLNLDLIAVYLARQHKQIWDQARARLDAPGYQRRLVGRGTGGQAHCNGWNILRQCEHSIAIKSVKAAVCLIDN